MKDQSQERYSESLLNKNKETTDPKDCILGPVLHIKWVEKGLKDSRTGARESYTVSRVFVWHKVNLSFMVPRAMQRVIPV